MAPVAFAFLLRWLPPWGAIALGVGGMAYAFLGSRRLAPSAFREAEKRSGYAAGKVFYAASVLALIALFPADLHVAAAAWGMLAIGDGCACLAGRRWGRRRLPWNPDKSWIGLGAFVAGGWLAALFLLAWVGGRYPDRSLSLVHALLPALWAALASAVVESLPTGRWVNDNLTVPATTAAVLGLMMGNLRSWPFILWRRAGMALPAATLAAFAAFVSAETRKRRTPREPGRAEGRATGC